MRVIQYDLRPYFGKHKKRIELVSWQDLHIGNSAFHDECFNSMVKRAKTRPNIGLGDFIEAIAPDDPRFAIGEHSDTLLEEIAYASKMIAPLAKTCIGVIPGNHEDKAARKIGFVVEDICGRVKDKTGIVLQHLSDTCYIDFKCPDGTFRGFFAHGGSNTNPRSGEPERRQVNKKIWLRNYLYDFDAYLKGIGHGHKCIVAEPVMEHKLTVSDGRVKRRPVPIIPGWHYMGPYMFRTYDQDASTGNYAERQLYRSTSIGWVEPVINRDGTIPMMRHMGDDGSVLNEYVPTEVD